MTEINNFPENLEVRTMYRPCLVVLAGLPLSGKSVIGNDLARLTNLTFLDVDQARIDVFQDRGRIRFDDKGEQFAMQTAYQKNHEKARNLISEGKPAMLAATYSRDLYHEMIKWLADKMNAPLRVFVLDPDLTEEDLNLRLGKRQEEGNLSNLTSFDHYLSVKTRYKAIEHESAMRINTKLPLEENINHIISALSDLQIQP